MRKFIFVLAVLCISGLSQVAMAQVNPQFVGEMSALKQKVAAAEGRIATLTCDLRTARDEARRGKDFARADEIRDLLAEQGILLEDGPQGTRWRREPG